MSTQAPTTTATTSTPGSSPTGRSRWAGPALLLPWLVAPVLLTLGYLLLPAASELRSQYQASAVVLVVAPLLAWLLTRRGPLAHHSAAALVAVTLPALTLISLHGTDWFFSGPFGDQSFRMQYATRFADDLSLEDYTYRDVPAFYSPAWFWGVGLVAQLTDLAGWQAYKWVGIASMYVAVALTFALWRLTCSTRLAAALVTATVIGLPAAGIGWLGKETLLFAGAYEPYAWLVVLPLPAVLTWFGAARGRFSWRRGVGLGALLAAAAWLYLLYALVAVIAVLAVAAWRWRDRARIGEVVVAGVTSVVLVLPWLGRFLVEWVAAGSPPAVATTWVADDSFVRLVTNAATPWLGLALLGAVGLLALDADRHRRLRGGQALGAAVLLLGVVQLVTGQAARGILFHRVVFVLGVTLLAAGVLVLTVVGPPLLARLRAARPGLALRRLGFAVLTVVLFLNLGAHAREWMAMGSDLRKLAHDVPYPDGTFPPLSSPATRAELADQVPLTELATAVREVAEQAGQDRTGVLLSDNISMLATEPFHAYLQWWNLYSNPLGEYPERREFLEGLEGLPADGVVERLREQPDAPTTFALRVEGDEAVFSSADWDPGGTRGGSWSVSFPVELFEGEDFESARVGDWIVAALRPA